jgi:hypothetical protein
MLVFFLGYIGAMLFGEHLWPYWAGLGVKVVGECHVDWVVRSIQCGFCLTDWGVRAIKCVFYRADWGSCRPGKLEHFGGGCFWQCFLGAWGVGG